MRKSLFATPLFAALLLAPGAPAAWAQSNPSTDQIINSLKPSGNLGGLTRGIRPSGGETSAPAAPATEPMPRVAVVPGRPAQPRVATRPMPAARETHSVNLTVEFATGSADLTTQAIHTLDDLGRALSSSQLAGSRFRIEGHTDTVGTRAENQALSERRANAVVDYIAAHYSVDRSRLEAVGMGEDGLLVPTPAQTPESRNRRVLVVNLSA